MRAFILIAAASLSLAGCSTTGTTGMQSPAPFSHTAIDDHAIRYGFQALDVAATLADQALAAKIITPGSEKAKALANGLDTVRKWLNIASAAQRAGSLSDYNAAFAQATKAFELVNKALGK